VSPSFFASREQVIGDDRLHGIIVGIALHAAGRHERRVRGFSRRGFGGEGRQLVAKRADVAFRDGEIPCSLSVRVVAKAIAQWPLTNNATLACVGMQ